MYFCKEGQSQKTALSFFGIKKICPDTGFLLTKHLYGDMVNYISNEPIKLERIT